MFETTEGKTVVTKREDTMDKSDLTSEIKILQSDYYEEDENDQQSYVQENPGTSNIIYEASAGVDQITEHYSDTPQSHHVQLNDRQSEDEMLTTTSSNIKKERKRKNSWNDADEDDGGNKYFALSVACSLKRLNTINNLKAKVEIYQILEKYASKENE
jgi:hypothetical protein